MATTKIDGQALLEFVLYMLEQWANGRAQTLTRPRVNVESGLPQEHVNALRTLDRVERGAAQITLMQVGLHIYTILKPGTTMVDFVAFVEAHQKRLRERQATRGAAKVEAGAPTAIPAEIPTDAKGNRVDAFEPDGVTFIREDVKLDRRWRHYRGDTYTTVAISAPAKRMGDEAWTYVGEARESTNGASEGGRVLVGVRGGDMAYVAFELPGGTAVERVIYKNPEGALRVRAVDEFLSGRFRPLDWVRPMPALISSKANVPDAAALILEKLKGAQVDGVDVFPDLNYATVKAWLAYTPTLRPSKPEAVVTAAPEPQPAVVAPFEIVVPTGRMSTSPTPIPDSPPSSPPASPVEATVPMKPAE